MDMGETIMEILMLKKHLKTGSSGKKSLLKCSSTAPTSSSFTTLGEQNRSREAIISYPHLKLDPLLLPRLS